MPYQKLDASRLRVLPLAQRKSYIDIVRESLEHSAVVPKALPAARKPIQCLAERIIDARRKGAAVMLAYGAHLVKNGAGPVLRWLIEGGWVTHLATQGAGVIHDWEFAFQGRSSESVRDNASAGKFGSWDETGRWISLAALAGAAEGLGFGESVGRLIVDQFLELPKPTSLRKRISQNPADELTSARADLLWTMERFAIPSGRLSVPHPCRQYSILAAAHEHRVPLTVHPGIGYDIIINHPMYSGSAIGRTSATDARIFAQSLANLSNGVYLSIGSAIMSPQVFEKAYSAVNNLRLQDGQGPIHDHYLAVVDIQDAGGWDWSHGEPPADNPAYYLRFCKTFARMGGQLQYIQCDNRVLLMNLIKLLKAKIQGRFVRNPTISPNMGRAEKTAHKR